MRIAYLSNSVIPSTSASSVHVMKMCQAFARGGHEVIVFAMCEGAGRRTDPGGAHALYDVEENFELRQVPVGRRRGRGLVYSWKSVSAAARLRPDLIYSRHLASGAVACVRGWPTVVELHGLRTDRSREDRLMFRVLGRTSVLERVVVISEALEADVLRATTVDPRKVLVAHDGADPVGRHARPPGLPHDPLRPAVGYVGHLYPGRGIELVAAVAGRLPGVDFHLVGGQDADVDRVRRQAPPNVHVHGFMAYADAEAFRLHCDVLIAPYQQRVMTVAGRTDTSRWMSPLKIFEYMAAGKPIVCSDLPVLREVLEHDRTALLVPPDDVDAWAGAVECLAGNADLRQRLGAAARRELEANYTWQRRAERVLAGLP